MSSSVRKQQDQITILGICRTLICSDRNSGGGQNSKRQKLSPDGVVENNANANANANNDTEDPQLHLTALLSSAVTKFLDQHKQQRKQEEEEKKEEEQQQQHQQQRQEASVDNPSTNEKQQERKATRNINSRSDDNLCGLCEENNYNVYKSYEMEFPENVAASSSLSKADYGHLANPPRLMTANEFPMTAIVLII